LFYTTGRGHKIIGGGYHPTVSPDLKSCAGRAGAAGKYGGCLAEDSADRFGVSGSRYVETLQHEGLPKSVLLLETIEEKKRIICIN
jgi:hypothetical protein